MKTKPQWTQATKLLLQDRDKLHLKPYKWLYCGVWEKLILNKAVTLQGTCK